MKFYTSRNDFFKNKNNSKELSLSHFPNWFKTNLFWNREIQHGYLRNVVYWGIKVDAVFFLWVMTFHCYKIKAALLWTSQNISWIPTLLTPPSKWKANWSLFSNQHFAFLLLFYCQVKWNDRRLLFLQVNTWFK